MVKLCYAVCPFTWNDFALFMFRYEYHWCDGVNYKRPTQLPAPQYISLLIDWVENQINNEDIFPVKIGEGSAEIIYKHRRRQ